MTLVEGQELYFDDDSDYDDYLEMAAFEDFLRTEQITLGEFLEPEQKKVNK